MTANDSNVDRWTKYDINESGRKNCPTLQRKIALIDTHLGETYEGPSYRAETRCSKSSPEIRYINPAIYTESVDDEEQHNVVQIIFGNYHQHKDCCNGQVIDSKSSIQEHPVNKQDTYRCYSTSLPDARSSFESFTGCSTTSSETTTRVEQQCEMDSVLTDASQSEAIKREKYILDNRQIVRISTTSLSNTSIGDCQVSSRPDVGSKRIVHSEWVRRKYEAAQRKREKEERVAKKQQEEEKKIAEKKEERARLEKENFLEWIKRKRQQELEKKALLENELELQKRLKEIEDKTVVAKTLCFRQWIHKKKEEQKTRSIEQEKKQRSINEEREKRLEQSSKAYEKWKETSKNRPKPATQGLLPHQKAKPAYVNPIPWQSITQFESDEAQEDAFNDKREAID